MVAIIFIPVSIKGIGSQTIVCALYESLHVAEKFATLTKV